MMRSEQSTKIKMQIKQYPFYLKSTVILFGLILAAYILFTLQGIIVPLAFSFIFAILLNPLYVLLQYRVKIPRIAAITLTILIAYIIVGCIVYFLWVQMLHFTDSFPALQLKFARYFADLQQWLQARCGLSMAKQKEMINEALNNSKTLIGATLGSALTTLSVLVLIPVYIFMLLFYKTLLLNFLFEAFAEENSQNVRVILNQTKSAIQNYMIGLLLEAFIVAILNSTGLLIIGLNYAILIGVMGAILNMLPYIGGIIAIAIPLLIATVTKDGFGTQIGVIISFSIVQFIDNHIIIPRVVSSKVQINALITVVVVLLGGALWGVSGMFLSIPFVAILKIIFDRIDDLKPWAKLLGDIVPTRHKGDVWRRRKQETAVADRIAD
ncbi:AI-2E family transporter [Mucilaginibacter sp. AW1-3]